MRGGWPGTSRIAAVAFEGTLTVWEIATGREVFRVGQEKAMRGVARRSLRPPRDGLRGVGIRLLAEQVVRRTVGPRRPATGLPHCGRGRGRGTARARPPPPSACLPPSAAVPPLF